MSIAKVPSFRTSDPRKINWGQFSFFFEQARTDYGFFETNFDSCDGSPYKFPQLEEMIGTETRREYLLDPSSFEELFYYYHDEKVKEENEIIFSIIVKHQSGFFLFFDGHALFTKKKDEVEVSAYGIIYIETTLIKLWKSIDRSERYEIIANLN